MSEPRQFGLMDLLFLLLVLAAAAVCRFGYLYKYADNGATFGPMHVQDDYEYDKTQDIKTLVTNLSTEKKFRLKEPLAAEERETAFVAPGYPFVLSLIDRFTASGEGDERWSQVGKKVRWLQAVLGTLAAGLYFLFARRAFRSLFVATLAGILCAVYPFWIINTAEIDDGVLASFALALCLWLGARGGESGGVLTSLLYGLGLAGLTLIRGAFVPFAFVAALWFLWRCRLVLRGWFCAILAFLGFGIGVAPWIVRNVQVVGEPFPIVDSTQFHLWVGNNSRATGGPQSDKRTGGLAIESPMELALKDDLGEETLPEKPIERAKWLGKKAWYRMRAEPDRAWRLRLQAGLYFFFGERFFKGQKVWQEERIVDSDRQQAVQWVTDHAPSILFGTLLGMLVLAVLGWRWSYGWRYTALPAALAAVWVPLPYILSHAESLSGPRLPLDGVLLTFAAFALSCFVPGLGSILFRGDERTKGIDDARRGAAEATAGA